tara:strand:+ start:588 stop:758 length:171 start_codon:yes stop_codon:yes gene_type:complete
MLLCFGLLLFLFVDILRNSGDAVERRSGETQWRDAVETTETNRNEQKRTETNRNEQ